MAASLMGQISSVTCRPPPGTSGPPPRVTHRPRSPPPRLTDPPQSPPRTAAGSHAAPRRVGRATAAPRLVVPDPSAVSQPSSQPPPSRCCDDLLNPSYAPAWAATLTLEDGQNRLTFDSAALLARPDATEVEISADD